VGFGGEREKERERENSQYHSLLFFISFLVFFALFSFFRLVAKAKQEEAVIMYSSYSNLLFIRQRRRRREPERYCMMMAMMKERVYKRNKNRMFSVVTYIHLPSIHTPKYLTHRLSSFFHSTLYKHSVRSFIMCWGCQSYFRRL
jgi:hypothetical protein